MTMEIIGVIILVVNYNINSYHSYDIKKIEKIKNVNTCNTIIELF